MIPYGRQDITQADIDAVVTVLQSDFLTQGPVVPRFEAAVAAQVNSKHAVAVNSATSALHIACMALGLGPGDLLWTVPNTFVASSNCALYCGASVDFVDIDPRTWNMSVERLEEKLVQARQQQRLPKVVVPVHFSGQPTQQERIWELAKRYGFRVIEDASHAIGAARAGELVGSNRWADITVLSFHPVKIVTTGEGGIALTNDAALAESLAMLRSHGITRDPARWKNPQAREQGAWYYEQQVLGYNYRMTEIHAALGISQLDRLTTYVARRNEQARRYDAALSGLPLQLPFVEPQNRSAFHLYIVGLLPEVLARKSHADVFAALRARGVGVNLHYMPVHLQPYYRELGFRAGQYPEAEAYASAALTLPLYPTMTEEAQDSVVAALREVL